MYIKSNLLNGILKIAWDQIPPGDVLCSEEDLQGLTEIYGCSKHSEVEGKQKENSASPDQSRTEFFPDL